MNTRTVGLCLALILACTPLHGQDGKDWKEFTAKEEGFRVLLPGTPTRQESSGGEAAAKWKQVLYTLETKEKGGYIAMWHSFAKDAVQGRSVDQMLDAGRDGGVNGVKGRLLSEKKIKLDDKHLGREWRFVAGDGNTHFRWRAYWVSPNMIYHVAVGGSKEFLDSPEAEKCLGSLKLLNLDK